MKITRHQINIFTIFFVGVGIQIYYKTRFFLTGQLQWSDILHWLTLVELLFGFTLAALVVFGHDYIVRSLRKRFAKSTYQLTRIALQFFATMLFSVGATILFSLFFWNVILEMPMSAEYIFDFVIISLFIPIFVNGLSESLYYYSEWEEESSYNRHLEKENTRAKYEILKNQISPHFLLNCFNTLSLLIEEGKATALTFLHQLSNVYRSILNTRNEELIVLSAELDILSSYIELLRIRFGESFVMNIDVPDQSSGKYIVPLTTQLLLENALKHNRSSIDEPLRINLSVNEQKLIFSNSLAPQRSSGSTKAGLHNISNRYQYLTGDEVNIVKTSSTFSVEIPLVNIASA